MTARSLRTLLFAIIASLIVASPALASLAGEVAAGGQVAQRVDAGTASCDDLKAADFEHLGEYAMQRMLGSRAAHEAMNARMEAMLGDNATERMHELIGRRYAGCGGAMMGATSFAWMRDGSWRHMGRADWQRVRADWMGPGMMRGAGHHSTSWVAIAAIALGALAIGALIALALTRKPPGRPTPPAPSASP